MNDILERTTRVVNGQEQIWDNILNDYRAMTALDKMGVPDKKKTRKLGPFSCPDCGSGVYESRRTTGWEIIAVDIETGEADEFQDSGTNDSDVDGYECTRRCGWEGDTGWLDRVKDNLDNEEEEEEAEEETEFPQLPLRFGFAADQG